jgi:hypothetical protein
MAQTGFTPIQLYYSSTTTSAPLAANLASGELAINITDGKLFYKDNANAVQVIGWKVVPATAGGTGQTSYAVGDLIYADTTTSLAKLADVATGNALISGGVATAPSWGKIGLTTHVSGTLGVGNGGTGQSSNLTQYGVIYGSTTTAMASTAAGTSTQVLHGNASGAPTWSSVSLTADVSGTLPTASGGTNLTSFTSSGLVYASSTSALSTGADLTFDGTNLYTTNALLINTSSTSSGGSTCKEVVYISNFGTTAGISVQGGTNAAGTFFQTVNFAGTINGSITQVNSGTIAFNTTSDYRLKENIAPMMGALDKVARLKPVTYTWKLDGIPGEGFIAHELQDVIPDAVTGHKDAVDANGNPKYQGIDTSFLVATLTAAIQELKAELDTLKMQINK